MTYARQLNSLLSSEKTGLVILGALWLLAQAIAYFYFGTFSSVDTELYVDGAERLLKGAWPAERGLWYLSYSASLALIYLLGGQTTHIVLLHLLASGTATYAIYKITQSWSGSNQQAWVAALLYVLWFKLHQWNFIVYTDSLFASATVITVALFYFARRKTEYLLAGVAGLFTVLLRPVGIGFLFALLGYGFYGTSRWGKIRPLPPLLFLVALSVTVLLLNHVLIDYVQPIINGYANAEIIYPDISLGLDRPEGLYVPDDSHAPLIRLALFMVGNPLYVAKISVVKGLLFIGHVKPYYSLLHNTVIGCFLYPIYFFATKGMIHLPSSKLRAFVLIFVGFQIVTVSLTSENWDGRFLLPVLPWIFMMASFGIFSRLRAN